MFKPSCFALGLTATLLCCANSMGQTAAQAQQGQSLSQPKSVATEALSQPIGQNSAKASQPSSSPRAELPAASANRNPAAAGANPALPQCSYFGTATRCINVAPGTPTLSSLQPISTEPASTSMRAATTGFTGNGMPAGSTSQVTAGGTTAPASAAPGAPSAAAPAIPIPPQRIQMGSGANNGILHSSIAPGGGDTTSLSGGIGDALSISKNRYHDYADTAKPGHLTTNRTVSSEPARPERPGKPKAPPPKKKVETCVYLDGTDICG